MIPGAAPPPLTRSAAAWRLVLLSGYFLILAVNLPGHLSADSVISLWEGRSGVRMVWGPPMYAAILGVFDRLSPGAGLYVAASALLLFVSWAALRTLRPRAAWSGPILLAGVLALPGLLIYQGIVWKDVLFANLTVAAFVCLAYAARNFTGPRRWAPLVGAVVLLAVGCLVRQNGAINVLFAGLVLAWAARRRGWRSSAAWGVAGAVAPLVLAGILAPLTPVRPPPNAPKLDQGVRMVQQYDLAAAIAADPKRPLRVLEAENPANAAILRAAAEEAYTPVRSDDLNRSPYGLAIWTYSKAAIAGQWRQTVLADPFGYVWRRLEVFRWVFATPKIELCLPVHVGTMGPPEVEQKLGMPAEMEPRDGQLFNYATWFFWSPAMSHPFWALMAVGSVVLLVRRRQEADIAMAGLLLSALAFSASFAVISIACDYRYLYLLDLAAITGLLYLALDPPRLRGARGGEGAL